MPTQKSLDLIPLSVLAREIAALSGKPSPRYTKLWEWTVSGMIPATQISVRWFINRDDLPAICVQLGLLVTDSLPVPENPDAPPRPRRHAEVPSFTIEQARAALSAQEKRQFAAA
jgi:hypothetical protein